MTRILIAGLAILTIAPLSANADSTATDPQGIVVSGEVKIPRTFTHADLEHFRPIEARGVPLESPSGPIGTFSFTGVRLKDLIDTVGNASQAPYRSFFLLEGAEGRQIVVSWGELNEGLGGDQIFIAYKRDGKPIPTPDGPYMLVVPSDRYDGRLLKGVRAIEVIDVGMLPLGEADYANSEEALPPTP